ncbi:MAG: RecQ family ATP-dependent DNA helicase [Chitinophagaceae bacterium]|nr:RecQ family ATP-dependent DNA helicase [Chitinophagaceae bacterium]
MLSINEIINKYWGYESFKGLQEPIINAVLEQQDVLALLPTGSGKSLCFQVPTMAFEGMCIVVSPLIALMKDQVSNLQKRGINAIALNSSLSQKNVIQVLDNAILGHYKFLYVSPERLENSLFKNYIADCKVDLIAVDEAHCISQWGYDFRPPYSKIAQLRALFPATPIIALTASATKLVQDDIVKNLQLKSPKIFQQSFERPQLSYSVFKVESKINKLIEIFNNVKGSGIVYCKNRKQTSYVAELLNLQNIVADYYHAGLSQDLRNQKQESWIKNEIRVLVCTNAFGMGIDKPDVRVVVHYDAPDCLENYYQEAGRAGRDDKKAYAVLLHDNIDMKVFEELSEIRYPSIAEIRKVYQALANYLQLPIGIGEGSYYDFDLIDFVKKFKLDSQLVLHVLKTLEQEEHISFNEQIFVPAKVEVLVDKNILQHIETTHPTVEKTLKTLLRSYAGILNNEIAVSEKQLAKVSHQSLEKINDDLKQLKQLGIIQYHAKKETPQIYFINNRADVNSLHINHESYFKRKKAFEKRLSQFLKYIGEQHQCRAKMIADYFNAPTNKDCGICDNCLSKKKTSISKKELEFITEAIKNSLSEKPKLITTVVKELKQINKVKLLEVVSFLQDQNIIQVNPEHKLLLSSKIKNI